MTIWSPDITGKPGPKYRIIADEIGGAIADGRLDRGARLPPQRDLAYQLGVSLNTVTRGYGEALRRKIPGAFSASQVSQVSSVDCSRGARQGVV